MTTPHDTALDEASRHEASPATRGGPDMLRGWLADGAARFPEKPYLVAVEDGRSIAYRDLLDVARRMSAFLAARGIGPNRRVALLANNSLEHLAIYVGVLAAGA
ncbi:MAG: AMP-binding protein, partial [Rhodospirillaceae bacterium]|nr:AMP-binding protein [Rhodospirillaceae bacterium]